MTNFRQQKIINLDIKKHEQIFIDFTEKLYNIGCNLDSRQTMNKTKIAELQNTILSRYYKEWRKLPRRETQDPYAIHISEVMSQQTQVDRVIPYRKKWMKDIPDYKALANLPKIELLSYRSWLWFNSRAIRLQDCAKEVIEKYNWKLPQNKEVLLTLPWIWPYTASAICSFAWNLPEPVIDTNIRRVLIFLLKLPEDISYKELEEILGLFLYLYQ